jgi:hypothetical protein
LTRTASRQTASKADSVRSTWGRADIGWWQEDCGSAIKASKIAGHSDLEMTGD